MLLYKQTALLTLVLLPVSISFISNSQADTLEDKQRWQGLLEQTVQNDGPSYPDTDVADTSDSSDVSSITNKLPSQKTSETTIAENNDTSPFAINSNQTTIHKTTADKQTPIAQASNTFNDYASQVHSENIAFRPLENLPTATSIIDIEASLNNAEQAFTDDVNTPTARLDGSTEAIGLDKSLVIPPNLFEDNTPDTLSEKTATVTTINPDDFLPSYKEQATEQGKQPEAQLPATQQEKSQNIFQKAQNRLFGNKGLAQQPKIFATLYLADATSSLSEQNPSLPPADVFSQINRLKTADTNTQPYKNIQAALENIYQDTVTDFTAALPTLKKTAQDAAEAVGYYDVKMSFQQPALDEVAVIIEFVGEPVRVDSRVIDVRGEGSDMQVFQNMEEKLPPLSGDLFNQGEYQATKTLIENSSNQLGFFDSKWLNSSADVILPDNVADVDLIYDTGQRYQFGEVVFFTIDEVTGKLTTDPNKLPVKQELLQQLVGFKQGQGYTNSKVNELRNDLATTRYFNNINVEEVMPADANNTDNTSISFESTVVNPTLDFSLNQSLKPSTNDQFTPSVNAPLPSSSAPHGLMNATDPVSGLPVDVALVAFPNMPASGIDNLTIDNIRNMSADSSTGDTNNFDGTANSIIDTLINQSINDAIDEQERETQRELAAITFSIDDSTTDKYNAIEQKANNLLQLPEDRLLNERTLQAQSTLGKISNTVSSIAKSIFPEQTEPKIPVGSERPVLADKKTPEQVRADKKVPLYVLVMSNKPYDAQIGLGYGTDTGFRTTAKLDNNLVNRDGYQAGVSAEWSNVQKKAGVYVSRPWKHPLDDTLSANLSYEETKINQGNADNDWNTKSVLAGIARNRFSDNNWSRSYSLRYRYDELDIGNDITADPDDVPVRFNSSNPKQQAVLLGYSMQKTTVDDLTDPKFGVHQRYSLEAGVDGAGTDTNMAIARAGVSGIYSFGEANRHQVVGKLNTGYLWADDFYDVPYTLRFFAGGDQSIRGYDYNSLSPIDNGYLTGGQVLAVGSAEYNYEFREGLRGAVFGDVGNAYDEDFTTPTKLGVGFGIRWASPVGPVRVDIGAGVTEESIPIRLHLFIGSPL